MTLQVSFKKQRKKLNKEFFSGEALYEAIKAIRKIH